jgi:hypothetical protein
MDSICLVINAVDFQLGGLLFLNCVQHRARSDSIVTLAYRGAASLPKFAINGALFTNPRLPIFE